MDVLRVRVEELRLHLQHTAKGRDHYAEQSVGADSSRTPLELEGLEIDHLVHCHGRLLAGDHWRVPGRKHFRATLSSQVGRHEHTGLSLVDLAQTLLDSLQVLRRDQVGLVEQQTIRKCHLDRTHTMGSIRLHENTRKVEHPSWTAGRVQQMRGLGRIEVRLRVVPACSTASFSAPSGFSSSRCCEQVRTNRPHALGRCKLGLAYLLDVLGVDQSYHAVEPRELLDALVHEEGLDDGPRVLAQR